MIQKKLFKKPINLNMFDQKSKILVFLGILFKESIVLLYLRLNQR